MTDKMPPRAGDGDQQQQHDAQAPPPLRRNKSSLRLLTELTRERISLRYVWSSCRVALPLPLADWDLYCSYLHAWTELYKPEFIDRNAFPPNSLTPAPSASHDTGLAAFAQLAALRIGVRRAFVTIVSRETEYVLAESTRTMSLQSDFTSDPKDKSWLGTSCFPRPEGLNDVAFDGWRRAREYREMPANDAHYYTEGLSPHWCIVSDASLTPDIQQRLFVTRAESLRF
jgi:hypothetical protein